MLLVIFDIFLHQSPLENVRRISFIDTTKTKSVCRFNRLSVWSCSSVYIEKTAYPFAMHFDIVQASAKELYRI